MDNSTPLDPIAIKDLPNELIEYIIKLNLPLPPDKSNWKERTKILRAYSLVNSKFRLISQSLLTSYTLISSVNSMDSILESIEMLKRASAPKRFVRNLIIHTPILTGVDAIPLTNQFYSNVKELLESPKGIKDLTFNAAYGIPAILLPVMNLEASEELVTLYLQHIKIYFQEPTENSISNDRDYFPTNFNNLRNLSLQDVRLHNNNRMTPTTLPSLKNLQLIRCYHHSSYAGILKLFDPNIFSNQLVSLELNWDLEFQTNQLGNLNLPSFTKLKVLSLQTTKGLPKIIGSTYTTPLSFFENFFDLLPTKLNTLHFPFTSLGFKPFLKNLQTSSISELKTFYYLDSPDSFEGVDQLGMTEIPFTYLIAVEAGKFGDLFNTDKDEKDEQEVRNCKMISGSLSNDIGKSLENSRFWKSVGDFEKGLYRS